MASWTHRCVTDSHNGVRCDGGGRQWVLGTNFFNCAFSVISLHFPALAKVYQRTFGQLKHLDVVLLGPQLEDSLRLSMEGSNGNNRFESGEFVGGTKDSCEPAGLNKEERNVCMGKTGRIPRCQSIVECVLGMAYMYSAWSRLA